MGTLIKGIRYSARNLVKRPGFTLIAIVTLAIGIGANTAVFSIVNAMLFRPRPVAQPEQLVELYVGDSRNPYHVSSYQDFLIFREQPEIFSGLSAYRIEQFKLAGAEDVEQVIGEAVSANYFELLGVNAIRGRTFLPEEDQTPGTHPVAVISHGLWQRRFGSNPAVIGQTITLNHQSLTVIGIAPPQYTGMFRGLAIEVWVPLMMMPQMRPEMGMALLNSRGNSWLFMVGRLRPEATLEQARARFDLISRQLRDAYPDHWRAKREESNEVREKFVTVLPESETRIPPDMLIVAQVAFALVLLVGAGLVMRSLRNISPARLGFDSANLVVAPVALEQQYDRARSQEFYRLLEERTVALPGVRTVSFVDQMPGGLLGRSRRSGDRRL